MSINGKKLYRTVLPVFLPPLIAATVIRIFLYSSWIESPFRYYHTIPGLDMQTHLRYMQQFISGDSSFSLYKLLFSFSRVFSNGELSPPVIIFIQQIFGVINAILTSFVCLCLFGNRGAAALSGVVFALYGTTLVYECFILPDSIFVFFVLFSLTVILCCRKSGFSPLLLLVSGASLALPLLVRFHAILWTFLSQFWLFSYNYRKSLRGIKFNFSKSLGFILWPATGSLIVLVFSSSYNLSHRQSACPVPNLPCFSYVFKVGYTENVKSLSMPVTEDSGSKEEISVSLTRKLKNYAEKFLMTFHHYEIPDNINCYFVSSILTPLKFSIGSMFLFPLALIGMFMIIFQQKTMRKCSILFLYIISFAIPLVFFIPLSRYRIIFIPVFCIFSVYPLIYLCEKIRKTKKILAYYAVAVIALLFIMYPKIPSESYFRSEDFTGFASVLEAQNADSKRVEYLYQTAFYLNPESISTAIHYTNFLMKNAKFAEASEILKNFHLENPTSTSIAINYASSLLGSGSFAEAEDVLMKIGEPDNGQIKVKYFYQLGESQRLQNRKKDAVIFFKKALSFAESDDQKEAIKKALSLCEEQ